MTDPDRRGTNAHARHDTVLVAAHAAGDLQGPARAAAEAQIAGCPDCSALDSDLRAIAASTRDLAAWHVPAAAARRDFRLTPQQAARLGRGSGWRRLLRPFSDGGAWLRPLAQSLTALGVAGILLTTVLPGFMGSTASAPALSAAGSSVNGPVPAQAPGSQPQVGAGGAAEASAAPTAGPALVPAGGSQRSQPTKDLSAASPAASASRADQFAVGQTPASRLASGESDTHLFGENAVSSPSLGSLLTLASIVLLLLGLGLLSLRALARRLG